MLLDDCKLSLEELHKSDLKPCVYQQTSWDSYQAIFKIPNNINRDVVNEYFKNVNKKYGDPKITGLKHGFRLSGFKNMKEKHKRINEDNNINTSHIYPFVRLLHGINTYCQKTINFLLKKTG